MNNCYDDYRSYDPITPSPASYDDWYSEYDALVELNYKNSGCVCSHTCEVLQLFDRLPEDGTPKNAVLSVMTFHFDNPLSRKSSMTCLGCSVH